MKDAAAGTRDLARREFLVGAGLLFFSACRTMSQVRATGILITRPHPDAWRPVLRSLIVTLLPFEHPAFPRVSVGDLDGEIGRLFHLGEDEDFAAFRKALVLFDDCPLFETVPAPFVDDERRDLAQSRVAPAEIDQAVERAEAHDRAAFADHARRFGNARFTEQSLEAKRAYLSLWAASEFIVRRRFYRGAKSLVTIAAYSTEPFWRAVGYEGPVLHGG